MIPGTAPNSNKKKKVNQLNRGLLSKEAVVVVLAIIWNFCFWSSSICPCMSLGYFFIRYTGLNPNRNFFTFASAIDFPTKKTKNIRDNNKSILEVP